MPTVMIEQPFPLAAAAEALAHEAVFVSRNPQLLLRSDKHFIIFREGEYRTSDLGEIEFLLGVVRDEERGNRGVQVRKLPTVMGPQQPAPVENTAAPRQRRPRGPDRQPRRAARKRGA